MMPERGKRFISKFLLPSLNSKKFGTRLMWLDVKYSIFQLQWNHKSASGWTKDDAEVFIEWDRMKGRFTPDGKECYTKSKQRFRAIMYKLIKLKHLTEICCIDKCTKIYCFGTKSIPSEVIEEAINSRGSEFCEISSERMCTCDPEAITDVNEISATSYKIDNGINIIEDHKYANLTNLVELESENIVPDNYINDFNYCDSPCLHVNIISDSRSEKQGTFEVLDDSYMQDSNDCAGNCLKWEVPQNQYLYKLPDENLSLPEYFIL